MGQGKEIKHNEEEVTSLLVNWSTEAYSNLLDRASATLFSQPCLYSTINK